MIKDTIYLTIPSKVEYIATARLVTSGIANKMNLTIDDIEDIKVCVGEACINALNWDKKKEINMKFEISDDKLHIFVDSVREVTPGTSEAYKEGELGLLIIKSLMDDVIFSDKGIEMIKYD